jgi:hypothetical protein
MTECVLSKEQQAAVLRAWDGVSVIDLLILAANEGAEAARSIHADSRDAKRYRFIAAKPGWTQRFAGQVVYINWNGSKEAFDAAVDDAIQESPSPLVRMVGTADGASADTARLNWVETHLLRDASMRFPNGSFKTVNAWSIASHRKDLREAIDAAMAASGG